MPTSTFITVGSTSPPGGGSVTINDSLGITDSLSANIPGAPGSWPTAASTGTTGTTTTNSSSFLSAAGATYNSVHFTSSSQVTIAAQSTFTNCRFTGRVLFTTSSNGSTMSDCTLQGGAGFSSASNITVTRAEITGYDAFDAIHMSSDAGSMCTNNVIEECYIAEPTAFSGNHVDGIHVRGSVGLTIRNNYIHQGASFSEFFNAALFIEDANGGNTGFLIEDNFFKGGGYWTTYPNGGTGTIRNNTFHRPNSGQPDYLFNTNTFAGGITHSGNVNENGNPIP